MFTRSKSQVLLVKSHSIDLHRIVSQSLIVFKSPFLGSQFADESWFDQSIYISLISTSYSYLTTICFSQCWWLIPLNPYLGLLKPHKIHQNSIKPPCITSDLFWIVESKKMTNSCHLQKTKSYEIPNFMLKNPRCSYQPKVSYHAMID